MTMIYCVVPRTASNELHDQLVAYYEDDPNVTVIIDRRQSDRRGRGSIDAADQRREVRDRRRARVAGELSTVATANG